MKNLYDLLGVRPEDDAESLRKAFRKAAKESHPDHHGGDPEAAARFRQIAEAYDILRDAGQRAAYDRFLEVQRRPLRAKLKQTASDVRRHIVYDVAAGVVLAIVLAGGYEMYARFSETYASVAGGTVVRDPAGIAAVQPAGQRGATERPASPQMPILGPAASAIASSAAASAVNDGGALDLAKQDPVPESTGQAAPVAGHDGGSDAPTPADQAGADDPGKNPGGEPPDERKARPSEIQNAAAEKNNAAPTPPPSGAAPAANTGVTVSGNKRETRPPEHAGAGAGDAKQLPDIKVSARPPAAKRQAATRSPVEQASLENRNTSACPGSQPCGDEVPPLFGLGY